MCTSIEEQLQLEQSVGYKKVSAVCVKPGDNVDKSITFEKEYEAVYGWLNKLHENDVTNDFFMLRNDNGQIESYGAEYFKILAIAN